MKKIFTLVAAAMVSAVSFAQTYSWSSPSGTVTEVGGTAESVTSKAERLNFPVVVSESLTYYTISLSGKVGNINAGAVDNDKDAVDKLYEWNDNKNLSLSFSISFTLSLFSIFLLL